MSLEHPETLKEGIEEYNKFKEKIYQKAEEKGVNEVIEEMDKAVDKNKKLNKKLCGVTNDIRMVIAHLAPRKRMTLNEHGITIRDGNVYEFNSSEKLSLIKLYNRLGPIFNSFNEEEQEKTLQILNTINKVQSLRTSITETRTFLVRNKYLGTEYRLKIGPFYAAQQIELTRGEGYSYADTLKSIDRASKEYGSINRSILDLEIRTSNPSSLMHKNNCWKLLSMAETKPKLLRMINRVDEELDERINEVNDIAKQLNSEYSSLMVAKKL